MQVKKGRLWLAFVREKKTEIFLYVLTVFLFFLVAGLYQLEEYGRLAYAVVLSLFFCLAAGYFQGRRYVAKRQALLLLHKDTGEILEGPERAREVIAELEGDSLEREYLELIQLLKEEIVRLKSLEQEENTARNDYYLMWTHQIKTPIAAMKLLLGRGEQEGKKQEAFQDENAGNMNFLLREELFKIEQYVEMVLHFQRLQSMESDFVPEECDLYGLLKQAVKKYSVLFINKGVSLRLEEMSLPILTDEKWFAFCMEQILSNSIKYAPKNKGVVSVFLSEKEENTLVIADNGMGIRKEDLPRIFERGFTGYNGRMDKKSTGIGLYLCKQILDRLGNEIRVESREGEGTRVYVRLRQRQDIKD